MNIVIIGGSGGIGLAMVQEALNRFSEANVHATYHSTMPTWQHPRLTWHALDAAQEAQVQALSEQFSRVDWLINCVGVLHTASKGPEKNLNALDADFFLYNLIHNALPSLLLAKHFTAKLKQSEASKFATLSAKVGSISDNQLGGWYSYRASKAALNMLLKTLAIEWQRSLKKGVVLALHPGTTDTKLSAPFHSNVAPEKLFSPARVAHDLIGLIAAVTPEQSGGFYAYDGKELPW